MIYPRLSVAASFLMVSFFAQALGGLGAGANLTASMAILSSFNGEEREVYIGWIEACNGIGLLFGPLIGSLLYSFGGYKVPFMFFGKYKYIFLILTFNFEYSNLFPFLLPLDLYIFDQVQ